MAHSLHNLVLDVCCNNTHLYNSREEALQVILIRQNTGKKLYLQTRKFNYTLLWDCVLFFHWEKEIIFLLSPLTRNPNDQSLWSTSFKRALILVYFYSSWWFAIWICLVFKNLHQNSTESTAMRDSIWPEVKICFNRKKNTPWKCSKQHTYFPKREFSFLSTIN